MGRLQNSLLTLSDKIMSELSEVVSDSLINRRLSVKLIRD